MSGGELASSLILDTFNSYDPVQVKQQDMASPRWLNLPSAIRNDSNILPHFNLYGNAPKESTSSKKPLKTIETSLFSAIDSLMTWEIGWKNWYY